MQTKTGWTRAAMAAILVAASASALSAQVTTSVPAAEIEALETKAQENLKELSDWGNAASLLRRAAALRPYGDPVAVEDLLQAARLSSTAATRVTLSATSRRRASAHWRPAT